MRHRDANAAPRRIGGWSLRRLWTAASAPAREAPDPEELRLIGRVAEGDADAFAALYKRYAPRVGGYLNKLLRRSDWVEEALDDTLLVVWQKAAEYDGRSRLSSWIFGIAHFKALKALERLGRERERTASDARALEEEDGPALAGDSTVPDPEQILMRRDLRESVVRALQKLSVDHRAVLELTFYEGFTVQEIAAIVGCPVNTVKTRAFHARRRLALALAECEADRSRAERGEGR